MRTTKPKILRNLARIFPTFLRPVLFGVRKLACAFPEPEQLHTSKGGSKLPHSKEHSGRCVDLCSSVVSFSLFCCTVKFVASFSPWLCVSVANERLLTLYFIFSVVQM